MESAAEIEVLLATYNGQPFLPAQIDSILAQEGVRLRIVARDDGSTDETRAVLRDYTMRFPEQVRVLATDRPTGSPRGNFSRLMESATAPYIMFSDQDDVWERGKARASLEAMRGLEHRHGTAAPLLVFTDLAIVDADLNIVHPSFWKHQGINPGDIRRLSSLLRRNVLAGCTAMINRALLERATPIPAEAHMHDWWIALLANIFGYSAYVEQPLVRYRQHGSNSVGAGEEMKLSPVPFVYSEDVRARTGHFSQPQAEALMRLHGGAMPHGKRMMVGAFLKWRKLRSGMSRLLS